MPATNAPPTTSSLDEATVLIPASSATSFVHRILIQHAVSSATASLVARCLVAADLRGVESHGIGRLPSYLARVRHGVLDPRAIPSVSQVTPAVALVDGRNGFGFLAARAGMARAVEMAGTFGVGMVSVRHSNHLGMAAWVVQQAVDEGFMALVFTNSSPALPVYGGKEQMVGVSPIACGAPGSRNGENPDGCRPFVLDMAPSVAARGKIYRASRTGDQIPDGWALDSDGNPTTEPNEALKGTMLPMGGPKGSALAIMMDVFSGVLSGSAFAGHVANPHDTSRAADVGHFLVAVKPDLFMDLDEFKGRMEHLYQRVVGSAKMPGVDRIYFPGEMEQLTSEERQRNGIPYKKSEIDILNIEAQSVDCRKLGE